MALRVADTEDPDRFRVCGRGELHLSILIETMRREGYELGVCRPEVILKEIDGEMMEPYETLVIDVEDQHQGTVMEKLGIRKGDFAKHAAGWQGSRSIRLHNHYPRAHRFPL